MKKGKKTVLGVYIEADCSLKIVSSPHSQVQLMWKCHVSWFELWKQRYREVEKFSEKSWNEWVFNPWEA